MKQILFLLIAWSFTFTTLSTNTEKEKSLFYKIDLKKEVGSTTWVYVQNGLKEANKKQADGIILHMNTYGGTVVHADSISTAILNSPIPVYAFIDNNAASAGALIAIACDSIYMRKGARIGAATVVNQSGEEMPDKYQSYMRATIRATAEAHGKKTEVLANGDTLSVWKRDPLIAEAMVDERVVVPGLNDSTKVLTFTTLEAIENGYCEGEAESVEEVIAQKLHREEYRIESYKPTLFDDLKGFLTNPALQAILIMLIIGGIYFELQSPGMGFPSIVAVTAAILYFAPLYIDGLAAHWEIMLFMIGVIGLILELFLFPGFGISGILGIILMVMGLLLALVNNVNFDFDGVEGADATRSILTVTIGIVLGFGAMIYLSHKIGSRGIFHRMSLNTVQNTKEGYIGVPLIQQSFIGKLGTAATPLRPAGKVEIEGDRYDAVAAYGYIEKGSQVKVIRYENSQLYVVAIKE